MTDQGNSGREKRNLGRGLAALFGEDKEDYAEIDRVRASRMLSVGQLFPGRYQPRRRFVEAELMPLVESIREKGVLQPLLVRRLDGDSERFEIIAGERRWRAAQLAQVHELPVVVRELSDSEALEIALVENIQRQDLTPLEEAEGYQRLMSDFSHTQEDLARGVGKSRSHVANMLRLLNLPDAVKTLMDDGALTMGHARALLNAPDPEALAREVVAKDLSVRQTERLAAAEKSPSKSGGKTDKGISRAGTKDADTLALERDLSMMLGLKVAITLKGETGDIAIHFETLEQLDDVLHRLKRAPQFKGEE
ncbi:MAG: ParB family chromosome partitioning protein [Alphaproteobacteria bacterium]|jgi:ParB family chromosome partitioning protein